MADVTADMDAEHAASLGRRYLIKFEEDTLRPRPLWIRQRADMWNDYTGWWIYILGPVIGAAIAVMIIGAVRGLPDKEERDAAQGGALPVTAAPAPDGH